jgi:hypothetical protein
MCETKTQCADDLSDGFDAVGAVARPEIAAVEGEARGLWRQTCQTSSPRVSGAVTVW